MQQDAERFIQQTQSAAPGTVVPDFLVTRKEEVRCHIVEGVVFTSFRTRYCSLNYTEEDIKGIDDEEHECDIVSSHNHWDCKPYYIANYKLAEIQEYESNVETCLLMNC